MHLIKTNPVILLYMLNAAVIICVALKTGTVPAGGDGSHAETPVLVSSLEDMAGLLLRIIESAAVHGRASLNAAIVTNAHKAVDALFRLTMRLLQPSAEHSATSGHGHSHSEGDRQLLRVLHKLAELSSSPDAMALKLETRALQAGNYNTDHRTTAYPIVPGGAASHFGSQQQQKQKQNQQHLQQQQGQDYSQHNNGDQDHSDQWPQVFPESLSQLPTPSFESLALLDGLDFVKWSEGLINGLDAQQM